MQAFKTIKHKSGTHIPLFIFGDHTSSYIPPELDNLGLRGNDLTRHIAHDIGTEALVRGLCARFGCAGQAAGVSRLVLDCNRDPKAAGLIPKKSDGTVIKGNQHLSQADKAHRLATIHTPYHAALSRGLDDVTERTHDPLIVSVHSFTPRLKSGGEMRKTEMGLLFKGDIETAKATRDQLLDIGRNFTIGMNKPYSAFVLNYTIDTNVMPRGLRHITFEVRQDLIDTPEKGVGMTGVLERVLKALI